MIRVVVASISVIGLALLACARPSPPARSAVLITIDTWRADRFGAGGHPRVRTPHLDRFFRRGTQFSEAYASIPTTLASHTTMLTGHWPTGHGVARNGWPVPEEVTTVAEILKEVEFLTAAFVSSAALERDFRLDQGFDVYDHALSVQVARDQAWRPAAETLSAARSWWEAAAGRRFLWVHLFEPHFPYDPNPLDFAVYDRGYEGPADGSMGFLVELWADPSLGSPAVMEHLEALYHAEITGLDRVLGPLLAELAREEATLTVLTSDHGESLGEHGLDFKHGPHVFPGDVQVPLVLRGAEPFGARVSGAMVRTVDLARTILAALGVAADLPEEGTDLARWAKGGEGLPVFAEASMPWSVEEAGVYANAHKQRVVRTPDWSYVETPWRNSRHWFDRRRDPGEQQAVPGPPAPERHELEQALTTWIDRGVPRAGANTVSPALIERLKAIGYIE